MDQYTLNQLAEHVSGKVHGNPEVVIKGISTLEDAGPDEITFFSNRKYLPFLKTTKAGAVITAEPLENETNLLIAQDPYYAFMQIMVLFYGHRQHEQTGINQNATIDETAVIGPDCNINNFVKISQNVKVGKNCYFYPGVFIGPGVEIGDDCIFYPNAVIYNHCRIGNRVIVHANATIGEDGFGYATHDGVHYKIPQVGRVILADDVEIGAGCAIERATLGDTIIAEGTKIGDHVAIGHGTKIGPHSLLVPQVGIAGSTTLGHHCVVGGQVGIVGHIKIGNMVTIGAQAGVVNDLPDGSTVLGAPAIDSNKAKRAYSMIQYLPDMRKRIRSLEKRLERFRPSK